MFKRLEAYYIILYLVDTQMKTVSIYSPYICMYVHLVSSSSPYLCLFFHSLSLSLFHIPFSPPYIFISFLFLPLLPISVYFAFQCLFLLSLPFLSPSVQPPYCPYTFLLSVLSLLLCLCSRSLTMSISSPCTVPPLCPVSPPLYLFPVSNHVYIQSLHCPSSLSFLSSSVSVPCLCPPSCLSVFLTLSLLSVLSLLLCLYSLSSSPIMSIPSPYTVSPLCLSLFLWIVPRATVFTVPQHIWGNTTPGPNPPNHTGAERIVMGFTALTRIQEMGICFIVQP